MMSVAQLIGKLLLLDPNERIGVMARHRSGQVDYSHIVAIVNRKGVDFPGLYVVSQSQVDYDAGLPSPLDPRDIV